MRLFSNKNGLFRHSALRVARLGIVSLSLVIAIFPTSALASGLAKTDWPTLGGNASHNKISPFGGGPLTIYLRTRPDSAGSFRTSYSPLVSHGRIYTSWFNFTNDQNATNFTQGLPAQIPPGDVVSYNLAGKLIYRVTPPEKINGYTPSLVTEDGTLYIQGSLAAAIDSSGGIKWSGKCYTNIAMIPSLDVFDNLVYLQTTSQLVICDQNGSVVKTIKFTTPGGTNGSGRFTPIDSHNVAYFETRDTDTRAVDLSTGQILWQTPSIYRTPFADGGILSLDEKYVAFLDPGLSDSGLSGVTMFDTKTGKRLWRYVLGGVAGDRSGTFAFGPDRLFVSAAGSSGQALANGALSSLNTGRVCALAIATGTELWCTGIQAQILFANSMIVDRNNNLYLPTVLGDKSFEVLDQNGNLAWQYTDIRGIYPFNYQAPALTDDGHLFYASYFLFGFRPWILSPTAVKKSAVSGTSVQFTVKSSMLRRDLQDGVTSDNKVQIRLDGNTTIPLTYLHQDGDDSVWEGTYTIPPTADLSTVHMKGSVEAIASQTKSAIITHFASVPGGFNNSGMVQSFDLGSVDKLSGTAAQNSVAPDDFTRIYTKTISWIHATSLALWSSLKHGYALAADIVTK